MIDRCGGLRRSYLFQKLNKYGSSLLGAASRFSVHVTEATRAMFSFATEMFGESPRRADKLYTPPCRLHTAAIGTPAAVWGLEIMLSASTFDQSRCLRGGRGGSARPQRSHSLSSPPEQLAQQAHAHARTQTLAGDRHTQRSVCVLP